MLEERHDDLTRSAASYKSDDTSAAFYHRARTHLSLDKDAPDVRLVEPPEAGEIVEIREVGGLHHRYLRRAA